jgi:hypothetical protein
MNENSDYAASVAMHHATVEAQAAAHRELDARTAATQNAGVRRYKSALRMLSAACSELGFEVASSNITAVACEAVVRHSQPDNRTVTRVVWIIDDSVDIEETVRGFRQNVLSVKQLDPVDPLAALVGALRAGFTTSTTRRTPV